MSLLSRLYSLKLLLDANKLNLKNIWKKIKELNRYEELTDEDYLQYLLYPERYKYTKMPSQIPIYSTCFHLRKTHEIMTNANGCFFVYFNPDFLVSGNNGPQHFSYYYDGDLIQGWAHIGTTFWRGIGDRITGNEELPDNAVVGTLDMEQIVAPIYTSYRLVNGRMTIRYMGNLTTAAGVIGGAICLRDTQYLGGIYYVSDDDYDPQAEMRPLMTDLREFGDFSNIRNLYGSREFNCLEGIKLLYYPIDNSYKEFTKFYDGKGAKFFRNMIGETVNTSCTADYDVFKGGFAWVAYVQRGMPNVKYQITVDLNFECLLDPEYSDYMPSSLNVYNMTPSQENNVIEKIRLNAIQKLIK